MVQSILANRVRVSTATSGTGTITLGSAVSGFQTLAGGGITDSQTVSYVIQEGVAWEVGRGVYTSAGTTLTRSVLESSNADAAISLAGAAEVSITALKEDIVTPESNPFLTTIELGHASDTTIARSAAGSITIEGNAVYRAGGTDVPVADGGTGSSTAAGAATNLGLGTGDSPQFTGIELGHATDTTITRVSAGVAAVEGSNILVSGGALGTPASGTLTNATGLPIAGLTASTVTAIGVGSVELGHATDTTLTRVSAGVVAIEGNTIYRAGGTDVPVTDGGTGASDASTALTNLGGQPLDATLTALAGLNTTAGVVVQTGTDTFTKRTLAGTANQITMTDGDGVSGAPTVSFPADVLIPTVLTVPNSGLHILDTNATHDLIVTPGSDLSADRILTITTGDAARTLDISAGSVTISTAGAALIDDAAASNQRTTLGLGTAAVVNTGTSGTTIPLLDGANTHSGALSVTGFFGQGVAAAYTIATGAITITNSNISVDTEAAAATDDLDTINGGSGGDILVIKSATNARDPTIKDGTGNLTLAGDFTMTHNTDRIVLIKHGADWIELSRSDNA